MFIFSGAVRDEKANCDLAVQIGHQCIASIKGSNFADVHLRRNSRVSTLTSTVIKVNDTAEHVNTMQLFNRIICVAKSDKELQNCFKYELTPIPLSLFDDVTY